MKVLLAHNGSESAARSASLVATMSWPAHTRVHLVRAYERDDDLFRPDEPERDRRVRSYAQQQLNIIRETLQAPARTVVTALLDGRPASVILDEARRIGADLLVLGSRGRSALESMLLGSVANEVADYASCPVLVARAERFDRVVLAHDGSDNARQAEALLLQWPFLRARQVHVVSAWSIAPGYGQYDPSGAAFISGDLYTEMVDAVRNDAEQAQSAALARLQAACVAATGEVRESPAADAIIATAGATDLIVLGARGVRGLERFLLGSVSRRVLHRAHASVLIVPQCARD